MLDSSIWKLIISNFAYMNNLWSASSDLSFDSSYNFEPVSSIPSPCHFEQKCKIQNSQPFQWKLKADHKDDVFSLNTILKIWYNTLSNIIRQLKNDSLLCHFQFSSVTQLCPIPCNPMNRSTPGLPVHHQLPKFTQTHVHQVSGVSDAIQPSHPLSSPSPPAPNPSQHQSLFQWVNSSHEVAKVLEFQL